MLGFMLLILLYADSVFLAVEGAVSCHHFESLFIAYSIVLTIFAFSITLIRIAAKNYKMNIREVSFLGVILCIIVSFWCTQYRFGEIEPQYLKAFGVMGVRVLPVIAVVCVFTIKDYHNLLRFIPVLAFLFTVSAAICILKAGGFGLWIKLYDSESNTYQSLGYYITYAYSLSIAYLSCERERNRVSCCITAVIIIFIPFQWICLLTLGGKGPILAAIAATGVVLMTNAAYRKIIFLFSIGLVVLLPCYLPILYQFAGIQRLLNIKDDLSTMARIELWQGAVEAGLNKMFIGNGIGAEYYLLGFHSHNIFLDIFMEYGLFGFLFLSIYLAAVCIWTIQFVQNDRKYIVLAVIFSNSVIQLMVSGYYLSSATFWGVIAYVSVHKKSVFHKTDTKPPAESGNFRRQNNDCPGF